MLAFEDLISWDDLARLAVNDVNFGEEAIYFFIFHDYRFLLNTSCIESLALHSENLVPVWEIDADGELASFEYS